HVVVERQKFHSATLSEAITSLEPATAERLAATARTLGSWLTDVSGTQRGAFAGLAQSTAKQAFALAYQDAFFVTAVVLAITAILVGIRPALPHPTTPRAVSSPEASR